MQHLDEGTIHAWLDGALAPNEASAAEAHVQTCEQCARAVAEARGLIAASSRILAALDDVPAVQAPLTFPVAPRRRIPWWRRAGVSYAAAAVALLAVGTTYVMRSVSRDELMERPAAVMDEARQTAASPEVAAQAGADSAAALRRAAPTVTAATGAANERQGSMLGARAAKNANEPQADKKEDLTTDRVVPLPGAMPRPQAPPPAVRQEDAARRSFAAEMAADAEGKAVVKGRVLDAASGAPVVGARVSVDSARVVASTDNAGRFELQAVPLGQQTVSVRALGFQAAQHLMQVSARDSVQLGFALQKAGEQLQSAVVTGTAQAKDRPQQQGQAQTLTREKAQQAPSAVAASPKLRLDDIRLNASSLVGCFTLRVVPDSARDADRSNIASMPSRVELDSKAQERAQREETVVNRARTLEGTGRAESWRFVGDSLELSWMDGTRRRSLRFARDDSRWVSPFAVMEPCTR